MSTKKITSVPSVPTNEVEAKAALAGAAIVSMDSVKPKATKAPTMTVDETKLRTETRSKVELIIRSGTEVIRETNQGTNKGVYTGGDTLHTNQVILNLGGK